MAGQALALLSMLLLCTVGRAQKDNGGSCDCFKTNGSTGAYFSYHRFFDYRNVPHSLTSNPKVLTSASDSSNAPNTSAFFSSTSWTADWAAATWDNSDSISKPTSDATVFMINSPNNVYIESSIDENPAYNTYLTLRTARTADFQSAAEIDTTALNYHYLSARYLARTVGDAGGCGGIFTWRCPSGSCTASSPDVEEADIEILTAGPQTKIQLTNQPSESVSGNSVPEATINATLPNDVEWSSWNEYRYDWLPNLSTWYVNGMSVGSISLQAPKNPAGLILNMWSNGGSWTGNMSVGDSSYLQIQWIEIAYNTSGPIKGSKMVRDGLKSLERAAEPVTSQVSEQRGPHGDFHRSASRPHDRGWLSSRGSGCRVVCSIDTNVTSTGTPVKVSMAGRGKERQATWPLVVVSVLLGFWLIS